MVDNYESHIDHLFYALSDSTRRKMLLKLAKSGECNVSELGATFDITKQAVSKHLKVLESAKLVSKQREGRIQRCQFNPGTLANVQKTIDRLKLHWENQFDALEKYIETVKKKEKT